jgi:hypothetical protein
MPAHEYTQRFDFVDQERHVLQYWRDIDAFQESLRQSKGKKPYTFYDGALARSGHGDLDSSSSGKVRRLRRASRITVICLW